MSELRTTGSDHDERIAIYFDTPQSSGIHRFTAQQLRDADPAELTEWEQAWREEFLAHPEVLACWGYSNGRWPAGDERNG